jgi:hypothetical protein
MTDYTKSTGSSGTMMIRDTGGSVQFWLKAGSSTFNHALPWGYNANGGFSGWGTYDFVSGGNWQNVGSVSISSSQNVTFKLGSTGTSGLGGPTDFTVWISRSTVANPPSLGNPYNITSTSVTLDISDNYNGGAAIGDHQIGYGTDPYTLQYLSALSGTGTTITIGGLATGVVYYFWARSWNPNGWSGWSNRVSTSLLKVPDAPTRPGLDGREQTSIGVSWSPNYNGGSAITGYDVGYGTSSSSPTTVTDVGIPPGFISGVIGVGGVLTYGYDITGLTPGVHYYVWVRARNAIGTGPWTAVSSVRTVAGAYINVGGTYHLAIPYVKVGGAWHVAHPYFRSGGNWKKSL